MATVLLFHHALGQTPGFLAFAAHLEEAGHTVHAPDLYEGKVFTELDAGVAHAEQVGFGHLIEVGNATALELPAEVVYAGFSLGALPAQALAQRRAGTIGALLYHGGVPSSVFATPWKPDVPLQIHTKELDPYTELDVVRELATESDRGELYLYPGAGHLFADPSYDDYDEPAATLLLERSLTFLDQVS